MIKWWGKSWCNSVGAVSIQGIGLYSLCMVYQYHGNILSVSTRYHVPKLLNPDIPVLFVMLVLCLALHCLHDPASLSFLTWCSWEMLSLYSLQAVLFPHPSTAAAWAASVIHCIPGQTEDSSRMCSLALGRNPNVLSTISFHLWVEVLSSKQALGATGDQPGYEAGRWFVYITSQTPWGTCPKGIIVSQYLIVLWLWI